MICSGLTTNSLFLEILVLRDWNWQKGKWTAAAAMRLTVGTLVFVVLAKEFGPFYRAFSGGMGKNHDRIDAARQGGEEIVVAAEHGVQIVRRKQAVQHRHQNPTRLCGA